MSVSQGMLSKFFSWFNWTITYHPGSKNTKPDALFHQFSSSNDTFEETTVLPAACIISSLTWEIKSLFSEALKEDPHPASGPPNQRYVLSNIQLQVI